MRDHALLAHAALRQTARFHPTETAGQANADRTNPPPIPPRTAGIAQR